MARTQEVKQPKDVETDIGNVKVVHTGQSLYMLGGGGDFKHDGCKGMFGPTVGGTAMIVYVDNAGKSEMSDAYMIDVKDMIALCVEHHKKLRKEKK